jgi:predicted Zn-dependent protease with MMP-like domain|tara:strand:+ start:173 stop:538 length:366 start_codon:yes stop_codon:yes gene_type:complete
VDRDSFEELVREAVASLPEQFLSKMGNVSVIVTDRPTQSQRAENGLGPRDTLFGLYEGIPLTERGAYVPPLPDVITLFQEPIEDSCNSLEALERAVRTTVAHEVAHYFGFSDEELKKMGID